MDISNKALAVLLIAAMIVSVGGALFTLASLGNISDVLKFSGITGFGTAGVINVSIQQIAILNVSQPFIDFGVGYVTQGTAFAEIFSTGLRYNWTDVGGFSPSPLIIQNIGNVNLSVSIVSDKNALNFMGGGTAPSLSYEGYDSPGSCIGILQNGWTEIQENGGLQNNTQNVCSNIGFIDGTNWIYVYTYLKIPYNSPIGNKTATWTFNCSVA